MKTKQYHVLHILVKNAFEAEDLLKKIKDLETFKVCAKKFSLCSSAMHDGDLGTLSWGKADENFEDAVHRLNVNEFSKKPVRTKFGYHLIYRLL